MRIIVTTYLTLDGVMQSPGTPQEDTAGGFTRGGWQYPYVGDGEVGERIVTWINESEGLLLGRRTYDIFAAYWPHVTGNPIAERFNAMPKYVASTTLTDPGWAGTSVVGSTEALRELRERPGGDLLVFGSGDLIGSLLDAGLVDELRLWTYPVVLGSGQRLFEPGRAPTALRLVETAGHRSGCVLTVYRPDGTPQYGDMSTLD